MLGSVCGVSSHRVSRYAGTDVSYLLSMTPIRQLCMHFPYSDLAPHATSIFTTASWPLGEAA
jgi:hypothetical protein